MDIKYSLGFVNGLLVCYNIKVFSEEFGKMGIWVCLYYVYFYLYVDEIILLMVEGKVLFYLDILF